MRPLPHLNRPPFAAALPHPGTPLTYMWEALHQGSTTVYRTKYGSNVTFTTGLPGLDLYAGGAATGRAVGEVDVKTSPNLESN